VYAYYYVVDFVVTTFNIFCTWYTVIDITMFFAIIYVCVLLETLLQYCLYI